MYQHRREEVVERGKSVTACRSACFLAKDRLDEYSVRITFSGVLHVLNDSLPSRHIFEHLGFVLSESEVMNTGDKDRVMSPPDTNPNTPRGRDARRKLLRFWVETSAWLLDYRRRHGGYTSL